MILTKVGERYLFLGRYDDRDYPKAARFRWDPAAKMWWTDDPEKAAKLLSIADQETRKILDDCLAQSDVAREASRATDAQVDVPCPEGLEYMPFQKAGIAYAMGRPACLIGDEPGLGKTIQAVGIMNADPTLKRVLIICPASIKINWQRELEKWLVDPRRIVQATSRTARCEGDYADILICNFDILVKLPWLSEIEWDLVVIDEAHKIKNMRAQRTKAAHAIQGRRKLVLTGTPIVNRPAELFSILHYLDPQKWPKFMPYAIRYANAQKTRWGWDFSGASNLDELQDTLRATIMVRRLKKDVLTELPPKRRQVVELPANGCAGIVARERDAWDAHRERTERLRTQVELAKADEHEATYKAAVDRLREEMQVAFAEISKLRHETAVAKIPQVVAHIEDALESEGKVVVFAWHHDVVDSILEAMNGKTGGSYGKSVRQMDCDQGLGASQQKYEQREKIPVQVRMRNNETSERTHACKWEVQGVPEVQADETWTSPKSGLQTMLNSKEQGKEGGHRIHPGLEENSNSKNMSTPGNSDSVHAQKILLNEPLHRQEGPRQGVYAREHMGCVLESERDQARCHSGRTGEDCSEFQESIAVRVDGRMDIRDRQESVDRFQSDPKCRVFVGNIQAAGVGLTLTASSHVIFAELDWVPGNVSQAEDRLHRIGQRDNVLVQHLVLEDSLDCRMAKVIVSKQTVIDAALDDPTSRHILDIPILPTREGDEPATASMTRKGIDDAASRITPDQAQAIHECLRILAGLDPDHALDRNGVGYNSADGPIGHSLAERGSLTPRQAALGMKIVTKYRRQIQSELMERATKA